MACPSVRYEAAKHEGQFPQRLWKTTGACWLHPLINKHRQSILALLLGLQDALHALSIRDSFNSYMRTFASALLLSTCRHSKAI